MNNGYLLTVIQAWRNKDPVVYISPGLDKTVYEKKNKSQPIVTSNDQGLY